MTFSGGCCGIVGGMGMTRPESAAITEPSSFVNRPLQILNRRPRTSQRRSPPSTIASTIARSRWVRNAASSAST